AADSGKRDGFSQELPDDVGFARADGAAHADFFCTFGYTDQHDVHDADAADKQSGSRERKDDVARHRRELGDHLEDAARRADAEIVRLTAGHAAAAAHQFGDLIDHATELIGLCPRIDGDV